MKMNQHQRDHFFVLKALKAERQKNMLCSIHEHGKFSMRGSGRKICWGDVGGDSNVQSTIREGNFFLFFSKFLKIRSGNYKF